MGHTYTDPVVIDAWLGSSTTADLTNASVRVQTPHATFMFRFPAVMPLEDRAAACMAIGKAFITRAEDQIRRAEELHNETIEGIAS